MSSYVTIGDAMDEMVRVAVSFTQRFDIWELLAIAAALVLLLMMRESRR